MNYKYKKGQIFGKRLDVPRMVLHNIYNCVLSVENFFKYQLEDKIPISCLEENDRKIVERFGIEKCKTIDWELVEKIRYYSIKVKDELMTIDPKTPDINLALFEIIKDKLPPRDYPPKMKELYSDRVFDINDDDDLKTIKSDFNSGTISLEKIIENWQLFKDKDLSYCLLKEQENKKRTIEAKFNDSDSIAARLLKDGVVEITDKQLKTFMSEYGSIVDLLMKNNDIYDVIVSISNLNTEKEKNSYIKKLMDELLKATYSKDGSYNEISFGKIQLTDEEYKRVFKYSSLEDYLRLFSDWKITSICEELKSLPEDYLFSMPIPFKKILDSRVLHFIDLFGLKNIVDFDNECGHFFTKNNCKMLISMQSLYLQYAGHQKDQNKVMYIKKDDIYSKDEFYEAMRRIIIYGPISDKAPYYGDITGEFREKNDDLFLPEELPEELEELKQLYYTKSLTPKIIREHPEYIPFLKDKNLVACFEDRSIKVKGSKSPYDNENIFQFLISKADFDTVMSFIFEYSDILDIIYAEEMNYKIEFTINDDINKIKDRINKTLRKLIFEKGIIYPEHIPEELIKEYPDMFLSDEAKPELKEKFYNRTLSVEFLLSDSAYIESLTEENMLYIFKPMKIKYVVPTYDGKRVVIVDDLTRVLLELFGKKGAIEIMALYENYIEQLYKNDLLKQIYYKSEYSKNDFLNELDRVIYEAIVAGKITYNENMPARFKKDYPSLFLDSDNKIIKEKFYDRRLDVQDFEKNPKLYEIFSNTNVVFGFPINMLWLNDLYIDEENIKVANEKRMKIMTRYYKINKPSHREKFKRYVLKSETKINEENLDCIVEVLTRLDYSNSIELSSFSDMLADRLLETEDPIGNLEKMEKIFLKNNLPLCGKMFLSFHILYPELSKVKYFDGSTRFNFSDSSRVAPFLKDESLPNVGINVSNDDKRLIVIFNDLLRISYRTNERSLVEYVDSIEKGDNIYSKIKNNNFDISTLSEEEKQILDVFTSHLEMLYYNTEKRKKEDIDLSELPLDEKIRFLGEKFKETEKYDLKNRIVRSFCYMAGVKSFDELKKLIVDSHKEQQERIDKFLKEVEDNNGKFDLQEGDFLRGIGYLESLSGSLKSGNYCKEQLSSISGTSGSDTTPLDIDLTLIDKKESIYKQIEGTPTGFGFGNIFVVLKKDNPNIYISRDRVGNLTGNVYDPRKIEVFGSRVNGNGAEPHWGARTGISFVDIDCIIYKENRVIDPKKPYNKDGSVNYLPYEKGNEKRDDLPAVKYEIAKNGYYIPVFDFAGKLLFTKEEFIKLREKMQGLKYYSENNYTLSDELIIPGIPEIVNELEEKDGEYTPDQYTKDKREKVNNIVREVLDELGITLKTKIDGDLSNKTVEFIDTGSTGRGTNVPYDGDFDFFMRLDGSIIRDSSELSIFKKKLIDKFQEHGIKGYITTGHGDLRIKEVHLDDGTLVDVDISFGIKTNKVRYSSDECLKDRLETIKKLYPDRYKYVVANIIFAKKFFKSEEVNAYKPRRTDNNQGGLGGIGIENWILQNGGSFVQAARSFVEKAYENGKLIPFEDFVKKYEIWDFGENHFAARDGGYLYDNFIADNMNKTGYEKMASAMLRYLQNLEMLYIEGNNLTK